LSETDLSQTDAPDTLPLFPLSTVLFPGGLLPLQVFETRYIDMVGRCMREGAPFGVVLLVEGREARREVDDPAPRFAAIGTRAHIVDFTQLQNGLLGITAQGGSRFRVLSASPRDDHLLVGRVETLPEAPSCSVPEEYGALVDILRQLLAHPEVNRLGIEVDLDDARAVVGRLAELLPLSPPLKQTLLELDDTVLALAELERAVHAMQAESSREA
jgi:Lon protease-like protein